MQLSGQAQDSGFAQRPWLIQRNGRFLQVPELVYRVLEQIDGERTLAEIAAAVSASAGRSISVDNLRRVIATKLLPSGLVAAGDSASATSGPHTPRSPLAVSLRLKAVSPRLHDPLTRVFQHLYAPPVLVLILLAAAVGHGWLYFRHGLASGVANLIYEPWLILLLTAITVVAGAFHELGHAAALRYGGGQVRGMGLGVYLIYPVFYTDVTGNYRLGRWARVRTDLGGFYFNLIFRSGLIGLYAVTGQEFLLFAVFLLDLEIIEQSLPFVRFDGYWALADLTGVPDFLSMMSAFWRSVWPWAKGGGRRLPQLKPWVKLVFVLYSLGTVPLLAFLFLVMIASAPRILATTWDSLGRLAAGFTSAQGSGDVLGTAAALAQILILLVPTVGLIYSLYSLGRLALTSVWRWSQPTAQRRLAGALGTLAACALLAYLWAPQLPWIGKPGPLLTYSINQFVPIQKGERGTVMDALSLLFGSGVASASPAPPAASPPPGNQPTTTTAPASGSPQPAATNVGDVQPTTAPGGPGTDSPAPAGTPTPGGSSGPPPPSPGPGNPGSGSPPPALAGTPGPGPGGSPPPAPPPGTGGSLPPPGDGAVPTAVNTAPTVVNTAPTVVNAVPTVANVVPTVINAVPTVAAPVVNTVPTVANAVPTVANAVPTVANAVPGVPTVVNSVPVVPTVVQAVPTVAQKVPTVAQAVPTAARIVPTVVNVVPTVAAPVVNTVPTVTGVVPTAVAPVVNAVPTVVKVAPQVAQEVATAAAPVVDTVPTVVGVVPTVAPVVNTVPTVVKVAPTKAAPTTAVEAAPTEVAPVVKAAPTTVKAKPTVANQPPPTAAIPQPTAAVKPPSPSDQSKGVPKAPLKR